MPKTKTIIRNGYEYVRITRVVGHREDGKPIRKEFLGKTKKEALDKWAAYQQAEKEKLKGHAKQPLGSELDSWIKDFFEPDAKLAYGTKREYINSYNIYMKETAFTQLPLGMIKAADLQAELNAIYAAGAPQSSIKKIINLCKRFWRYCEQEGITADVTANVVLPGDKPVDDHTVTVWTPAEIDRIMTGFDKADPRFRLRFLIILAYRTGARIGELLGLKYSDFDTDAKVLHIRRQVIYIEEGKQKMKAVPAPLKSASSKRTIPIDDVTIAALQEHRIWHALDMIEHDYETDYLFTTATGEHYYRKNIERALRRYYARIGIGYKPIHTYRHTYATTLARRGTPIQTVSELLGHSGVDVTAKYYIGISIDDKIQAINLL